MDAANAGKTRVALRHVLAGLEAGVLGALWMFVWLILGSAWSRRSVWALPNLFATTFFGPDVYRNQYLGSSWTGVALLLTTCGLAGMLWGMLWRDNPKPWLALAGALTGLMVYFLLFDIILRRTNPLIFLYAPDRQLQIAYVFWGLALARSPRYSRRIALATGEFDATAAPEPVEIRSGELIR
ncbi:MAG TPA: hypothetical protein VHB50_02525 [Bryobacteraceae bacterium]|nr:hypothetical protein [Bryobacteraceae bacterium]